MTSAQRPSIETVTKFVTDLLDSRKFEGLRVDKIEFIFFPSAYVLTLTWNGRTMTLKIPSELVEDAITGGELGNRRKVKKMIKQAFGQSGDDDN